VSEGLEKSKMEIKKPTYAQLLQENSKLKKELDELKQKLQRRYDECKRIEETTASPLWREGARWNMKLIEELLKEEKEAQPKKIDVVEEMDRIERRESLEEGKKP
jgi:cell division septum initiation protein DivIVA